MKKIILFAFLLGNVALYGQSTVATINKGYKLNAGQYLDTRMGTILAGKSVPYSGVSAANAAIFPSFRCVGMTVLIDTLGTLKEYWYFGGTANGNLIEKGTVGTYTAAYGMLLSGTAFRVDSSVMASQARLAAALALKQGLISSLSFTPSDDGASTTLSLASSSGNITVQSNDSNIAFTQAGTGAVPLTVRNKLKENVTVEDFGARGYELANDDAALHAAVAYCNLTGADLTFKTGVSYIFKTPLVFNGTYNVYGFPQLYYTEDIIDGAVVVIGTAPTTSTTAYTNTSPVIEIGTVVSSQSAHIYDTTFVGVEVINASHANISINKIINFGIGLRVLGVANSTWNDDGTVYSTFNLPSMQYCNEGLILESLNLGGGSASGFVNQNLFFGGAINSAPIDSAIGVHILNNANANVFFGTSIEMSGGGKSVKPIVVESGDATLNRFENIRNETNLGTYFAYFKKGSFNNSVDLLYNQESDGYCSGIINYDSSNRNKITEPLPKIIDKLAGFFSFNNLSKINSGASVAFKPYLFFNLANPNPKVLSVLADSSAYGVRNGNLRLSGGKNGSEGLVGVIKTKGIKYISATLTVSDTAQYPNLFAVPYKDGLPVTDAQDSLALRQFDNNGRYISMTKTTTGTTSVFGAITTKGSYDLLLTIDDSKIDEIYIGVSTGATELTYTDFSIFAGQINKQVVAENINTQIVDSIYRTLGKDSIQFSINGKYYAIKDSTGGGSGTVTSVATGYGLTGGTITTTGTIVADTTTSTGLVSKDRLTNALALKVNISDTAAMLSPYLRAVGLGLTKSGQTVLADTTVLSSKTYSAALAALYVPLAGATYTTTTGNGLALTTSTLTTGNLVSLASTGTAAGGNTQNVLRVATSGANGTSTQTTYGQFTTNTHTGTTSTNVAGYFSASGGTNNYSAIFENGSVGIGTTAPASAFELVGGDNPFLTSAYGANNAGLVGRKAQGTQASPTAVTTDNFLTFLSGRGYQSTGGFSSNAAVIAIKSAQGFTSTANGTYMTFETTPLSSITRGEVMRISAEASVGIGTGATIAASAILALTSTTKGFLPPKMTATQGSAISSPAEGLLIYVTDTNGTFTAKGWWGYDGAAWQKLNN